MHRDVKPENLLVDNMNMDEGHYNIKIIDFGISTYFDPKKNLTLAIGTVFLLFNLFSHTMLLQKSLLKSTMKSVMFGVVE